MKKRFVAASLAAMMVLSMTACGGGNTATTAAPAETKAEETTAAEAKEESKEEAKESEATAEKAPEDYTGTVVVYSPHDADPLNAGVNLFMEKYPNVKVEVVAAGTGELCNRIAAESANPIADVLWGGGADSLAAFKDYFAPYVCANDDVIAEEYKDPDDKWIGESPLPMVPVSYTHLNVLLKFFIHLLLWPLFFNHTRISEADATLILQKFGHN